MTDYLKRSLLFRAYFKTRTLLYYYMAFRKKFIRIKGRPIVWGIWNVEIYGPNISLGENVVIIGADGDKTRLTTVKMGEHEGSIDIGDNVLVMNGVRISSASGVKVGDDCMLANYAYLTDADWHGLHNRISPIGKTAPIVLEKGVWVGDSAIVCKGVHIGRNSVVAAGAVVTKNVPANVVVAGNPARVVKKLDPKKVVTMGELYNQIGGPRY